MDQHQLLFCFDQSTILTSEGKREKKVVQNTPVKRGMFAESLMKYPPVEAWYEIENSIVDIIRPQVQVQEQFATPT
jgi:hypothetical protein